MEQMYWSLWRFDIFDYPGMWTFEDLVVQIAIPWAKNGAQMPRLRTMFNYQMALLGTNMAMYNWVKEK